MGKNIISQRRGRGSPTYRVPEKRKAYKIEFKNKSGMVVDILNDPIRFAPIAKVEYMDKTYGFVIASEGLKVGDSTEKIIMPLYKIPTGSQIFAIETYPNSGPKLCRSAGSFAILSSADRRECIITLPSKKKKTLNPQCRAIIGIPAGDGRKEKPWVKAGKRWIAMHARGKLYPRTSAVSMNAVDHPFGGGGGGHVKPPASRDAPPGRKVGTVASRRTGRKK